MPTTDPYSDTQLRDFVVLLQELKLEDHEPPETWIIYGLVQPWAGFIQEAAIHYKSVVASRVKLDNSATEKVRKEFLSLKKLIKRNPDNPLKVFRKSNGLSISAIGLLNLGAAAVGVDIEKTIRGIKSSKRSRRLFFECLDRATSYLNDPPGPSKDIAFLEFAAGLVDVYVEATGRKIGRGFKYEDPEYLAPLESFLMATITPVRRHTSIDSVRGLIRKLQQKN